MTSRIVFLALIVLIMTGCSSNKAPSISEVVVTPNPTPKNQTAELSVKAIDPEKKELSYDWTASIGSFPTGNMSSTVTWVPPQVETECLVTVKVSDDKHTIDTTISVLVSNAVYSLRGRITNQAGNAASELVVSLIDSDSLEHTTTTDDDGGYAFASLPEGSAKITLSAEEKLAYGLSRYIPMDTIIAVSRDDVLSLNIRELQTLFYDDGTRSDPWDLHRVDHDGSKYILNHSFFSLPDEMRTSQSIGVPSGARNVVLILTLEAAPIGEAVLGAEFYVNGKSAASVDIVAQAKREVQRISLESVAGLLGSNTQLRLKYKKQNADYIYIHRAGIFCY